MLKKAGIVVLGATAGMLSLAPLASAGESPSHGDDHGHSHHHDHGDRDRDRGHRGDVQLNDCGESAGLVNVACVANNAQVKDINILASDEDDDEGGRGGRGGDVQVNDGGESSGLVNVANVLNNPQVKDINVLSSDG